MAAAVQPERAQPRPAESRDVLTGLMRGSEFERRLTECLASATAGHPLTLLFLGVDRLRRLNQSTGYAAGDAALQAVARRLTEWLAEQDAALAFAGRMGGDEFAAVLDDFRDPVLARARTRALLNRIRAPITIRQREVFLTVSCVVCPRLLPGLEPLSILRKGSAGVAKVRERGGNAFEILSPGAQEGPCCSVEMEAALRGAIEHKELKLRFQPQVDKGLRLDGLEALVGWEHPVLGSVNPHEFIHVAEDCGLIFSLGEWVLRQTCCQIKDWRFRGIEPPRVAVNVSPLQFASPDFVDLVAEILEETGVPGSALDFEITENAVLRDLDESAQRMHELRKFGISFSIDDFGVGYSPLTYLHRLPVDSVKVARDFTGQITKPSGSLALVHTITVLAHHRGLKVVAEGVETEDELELVQAARCDRMQGFLFGSPVPAAQIEALLRSRTSPAC
jgi:diguanylate cyclase (GGDEF)-like protein